VNQLSSHPRTKLHWWVLRGLVEVLRILFLVTGWVAPLVIFILLLIFSIIGIVYGSESPLDGVAAFLGGLISYGAAAGAVFLALWALIALLEWVLPPAYRPHHAKETPFDLSPSGEQVRAEPPLAISPVLCPDPQCNGFLHRSTGPSVYLDPHTGKQVSPSFVYGGLIRLLCFGLGFFIFIGASVVGVVFFSGSTAISPAANTLGDLGFIAGVVVAFAGLVISHRKEQAARRRAEEYANGQCPRCGKWWLIKLDPQPPTSA
jgi:hypothetical protein